MRVRSLVVLTAIPIVVWFSQTYAMEAVIRGGGLPALAMQACTSVTFQAGQQVEIGFGSLPLDLTSADFNNDGKADLAVVNKVSNTVSVLMNDGTGNFQVPVNFATGALPISIISADFNSDGKADLATANSDTISVLLNNGSGSFLSATSFPAGDSPSSIVAADFNGDGKADLAVSNSYADSVSVLLNNGSGGFLPAMNYSVGDFPCSIVTADFNADGKADLVTANNYSGNVSVLLNNANGGFGAHMEYSVGNNPSSVTGGDFNGDGKVDIATTNSTANSVSVLLNNGSGSFLSATSFPVGDYPGSITAADFNGDGKADLAISNNYANSVFVLLNNGGGGFLPAAAYAVASFPSSIVTADLNSDGKADLATSNFYSFNISTLLQNSACESCGSVTIAIAPANLPNGDMGGLYSQSFTSTGGSGAITWSLAGGNLPGGLALNAATGVITGRPNASGNFNFTVRAKDINNCFGERAYRLVINPCPSITIVATVLPSGGVGSLYSQTISAAGGIVPYNYSVSAGVLPMGLTLNSTTGVITGMPVAVGQYNFTLRATDSNGCIGQRDFSLVINAPMIITVNSASDIVGNNGTCTLREAIINANNNNQSGSTDCPAGSGRDTILFNIPGSGPHTISLTSALPTISTPLILDGTSQPGASCTTPGSLKIVINGANAGNAVGLTITAGNSEVRGLVVNRFGGDGISLMTGNGNTISCNYVGTDVTGMIDLGNGVQGIQVLSSNNLIGGTSPGAGNLVSGNTNEGVNLVGGGGNQVLGNYLGTNATGAAALGNNGSGVFMNSTSNNIVGGTTAGARNVISGNSNGVTFFYSSNNQLLGNYIGLDASGTADLGNTSNGVWFIGNISDNLVGGTLAGTRNVISGNNANGILIDGLSTNNQISGNYIGTNASGTGSIANSLNGVRVQNDATNTLIGGTIAGSGNRIAFNGQTGVAVVQTATSPPLGNRILGNEIFGNTGLGIDLRTSSLSGVTANDTGDGDVGPNNYQNFPVLASATSNGTNTAITGTLNSTVNATYTVQFFSNSACDSSGNGEGQIFLGQAGVTTDANGNASFNATLPAPVAIGAFITATATDAANNTSEFSACRVVTCATYIINPALLPNAFIGLPYSQQLAQTGGSGTLTWSISAGSLPNNLTLNPATGLLSGTLSAAGSFPFTVKVTDANGCMGTQPYTLVILACPTITVNPANSTLPAGHAGTAYSQAFTQTGGAGAGTFTISAGVLPTGLTLAGGGLLSGTPAVNGTFNFTVRATDNNACTGERAYTLFLNPPCATITVNPATLANGFAGAAYNQTLTASPAGSYTFAVTAGALPGGLTLANVGTLTGTPANAGTFNFTVTVTDNTGCTGTRAYSVIISGNGLMFYALPAPVRLLDTRPGASPNACSQPNAPIAGGTARLQAGRSFCGTPANAQALTGNITTVNSGGGYLTLYPSSATQPIIASTNYGANEIVNNVFTVGLGAGDGAFNIFALNTSDVVVDVTGYYAPPTANGLYFHALPAPVRLLETRPGEPIGCVKPGAPLTGGTVLLQTATTACTGIPAAARSVVGNATTVSPAGSGYLTLYPADVASTPLVGSSNYTTNQVVNGPFTVGLSPAGQFKIFTTHTTHLVVDVLGYYSTEAVDANGAGLLFTPLAHPVRLLETRAGQPVGCFKPGVPLNGGQVYTQAARGLCDGLTIPANALGVVGNATVVFPAGIGFLTLWPSSASQPLVAASNYNTGDIINRHFIVGLGAADGAFKQFANVTTDLIVDVSGYFAP